MVHSARLGGETVFVCLCTVCVLSVQLTHLTHTHLVGEETTCCCLSISWQMEASASRARAAFSHGRRLIDLYGAWRVQVFIPPLMLSSQTWERRPMHTWPQNIPIQHLFFDLWKIPTKVLWSWAAGGEDVMRDEGGMRGFYFANNGINWAGVWQRGGPSQRFAPDSSAENTGRGRKWK